MDQPLELKPILTAIVAIITTLVAAWKLRQQLSSRTLDSKSDFFDQVSGNYRDIFNRQETRITALETAMTAQVIATLACEERADKAERHYLNERYEMQRTLDSQATTIAMLTARIAAIDKKGNGG